MAIPPAEGPVLRLRPASRVWVGLWLGFAAFFFLFSVGLGLGFVLSAPFRDPKPGEASRLAQLLVGAGLLALALLPAVSLRDQFRAFRERNPHLRVGTDGITVWDRGVFVDPQLISATVIRRIAIGPGVTRSFGSAHLRRRVILAPDIPLPNALLAFRQPVLLDRAFGSLSLSRYVPASPPSWDRPVEEVWLAFDDPECAYRVLREWGAPVEWEED
jgi:hypothetical protein